MRRNRNQARQEYNQIARQYADAKGRLSAQFSIYPTFAKAVGRIDGLEALDLACGEGYTSRILAEQGAKRVVGVDISEEMIYLARQRERKLKQGIEYHVFDASHLEVRNLGKFDLVTAAFLLNYSTSRRMLYDFVENIDNLTKPEGRVVGLLPNSDAGLDFDSLSVRLRSLDSQEEGSPYLVEFKDEQGKAICSFTNYFWKRETYESIFRFFGFKFKWHKPIVSAEGLKRASRETWQDYLRNPTWVVFEAKKQ